jgi:hypothetical protein
MNYIYNATHELYLQCYTWIISTILHMNYIYNVTYELYLQWLALYSNIPYRGRCGRDRMSGAIVAVIVCQLDLCIGSLDYLCNQCLSPLALWVRIQLRQDVLDTTLCDKVCQLLATGRWFSPGTPVPSFNKADHHDITEILLKVA